jgi:ATP-dependent exoDNAse (exonuclease V) beta subunit
MTAIASAWEAQLRLILIKSLKKFEEIKHSRRMATFGDIVRSALTGLSSGSIAPPRPKLLLVDEYQDTSMAQDAFLNALEAERVVRVGDIKQAIYGFRGGTSDLLKKHMESAGNSAFRLPFNFRSAPPIVDLANTFVNKTWPTVDPDMEHLETAQIPKSQGNCPIGTVLTTAPSRGTDLPALSEWIAALSDESGWEEALGKTDDISSSAQKVSRALLLRQRTKLSDLLLCLKQKGIRPYVLSKEGFWDSPGPRLIMVALEVIAYPSRQLPFAVLLRHLVGLNDMELNQLGGFKGIANFDIEKIPEEKQPRAIWLMGLKNASAQQIAAYLLAQGSLLSIIASLDAHGAMEPERARRNLAGFLAMFQNLPADPGIAYSLLDELRNGPERGDLPSSSQNADLIIQTVHGSKGLEYDDVILPLLNNQKNTARKGQILTDPDSRSLLFAWKLGVEPGKDYKRIAGLIESQERRDDLNLLYVALTRAKKRLCLIIQTPENAKEKEKTTKGQHYSWARLGKELLGCHDKVTEIKDLPPISPRKQLKQSILVKPPHKMPLTDNIFLHTSDGSHDNEKYIDNLHFRQEGIDMHAYLQNLLVRWEDLEAFNLVLNNPPHVPNAKELAIRFLNEFESRGWRHLRRRTELILHGASESGTKGRADLVVWDKGIIHLIDFKHISKLTPEGAEIYAQQLNRYASAITKQNAIIKGWLVLLKSGEWMEMPVVIHTKDVSHLNVPY